MRPLSSASHEPAVRSPGFSRSGPPEGGTPNEWRPAARFMVPVRAKNRVGASHEPTHPRPLPGGEQVFVRVLSVPLLGGVRGGFMVPMRARKRMEALQEAPFFVLRYFFGHEYLIGLR